MVQLGDQFPLKRAGPPVMGICLDERRDSAVYSLVVFYHNLIAGGSHLTLGYYAGLLYRGVLKSLKYKSPPGDAPEMLRAQVESAREPITFDVFMRHVQNSLRGKSGNPGFYLPHVMLDLITVGRCWGMRNFTKPGCMRFVTG